MEESILKTVRRACGLPEDYTEFDPDLILLINGILVATAQLGVGPKDGFEITDESTTWGEYLQSIKLLNCVKTYISLKARLAFDPPTNSTFMKSLEDNIKEAECRMTFAVNELARSDSND